MSFTCIFLCYVNMNVEDFQGKLYTECKTSLGKFKTIIKKKLGHFFKNLSRKLPHKPFFFLKQLLRKVRQV